MQFKRVQRQRKKGSKTPPNTKLFGQNNSFRIIENTPFRNK